MDEGAVRHRRRAAAAHSQECRFAGAWRGRAGAGPQRRAAAAELRRHNRRYPNRAQPGRGSGWFRAARPGDGGDQPVGDNVEHHLAGGPRRDRDHHGVAGAVLRLVQRGFQEVRRVGVRLRIESGIEAEYRGRGGPVRARHFEAMRPQVTPGTEIRPGLSAAISTVPYKQGAETARFRP
jgi:hypothetical protein